MERETCFICGTTISRGNRSEVSQQKMDKLVSVQRTVDHSSTIICDILSRILNETVMGEENVCRLCYNLLNDIDYHLKVSDGKERDSCQVDTMFYPRRKPRRRLTRSLPSFWTRRRIH